MKAGNKAAFLILALVVGIALTPTAALAHRFNVALVIPPSDQGRLIQQGLMLATTERDSHPDEESDGHLGGLDVYVTVTDGKGAAGADIVAAFGPETTLTRIGKLLDGTNAVLLPPGVSPFSNPGPPGVATFISAYEMKYGSKPTPQAAEGYHAARRIGASARRCAPRAGSMTGPRCAGCSGNRRGASHGQDSTFISG